MIADPSLLAQPNRFNGLRWGSLRRRVLSGASLQLLGSLLTIGHREKELDRRFRLRSERVFDRGGYLRYTRWRISGDQGLRGRRGEV